MRVLLLRRQNAGPLARFVDELAETLPAHGVTAVVHDGGTWIPEAINRQVDRQVSKELRDRGSSFDLVHAFGYRCAWAAAETYEDKEAWVYSALDMPRSTHPFLVERLNWAQRAMVASRAIRAALEDAEITRVELMPPGVLVPQNLRAPEDASRYYELPEGLLVGIDAGTAVEHASRPDSGLDAVSAAWKALGPSATLVVLGDPEGVDLPAGAIRLGTPDREAEAIGACDIWLEAGRNFGWSRSLAVAMSQGRACLVRRDAGLGELIADQVSGVHFENDADLAPKLAEMIEFSITREAFGNAARVRFDEQFAMRHCVERTVATYRQIVGEA